MEGPGVSRFSKKPSAFLGPDHPALALRTRPAAAVSSELDLDLTRARGASAPKGYSSFQTLVSSTC